jgi:thioredoxin 1
MNEIKDECYDEFVQDGSVVVYFAAPWCGPCKNMGPILEKLSQQYSGIQFGKVNIDNEFNLAKRFAIKSIPTMMFYNKGKIIGTLSGSQPQTKIQEVLQQIAS